MRTKQALKNVLFSLLLQFVVAVSGMVIPKLFISLYGSSINGLVSSINQFITCMGLVEAGIGAAGTVALYGPIANQENDRVSSIVSAARRFYTQSGILFTGLVAILIVSYPFVVKNEITDASFVRIMILVLSVNGLVDFFLLGKYRVLLMADQRGYIISIAQIIGTVITMVVSITMMVLQCSALAVKSAAAAVYFLRSFIVMVYAKRHYPAISFRAQADKKAFSQRWSALLHQVVGMLVNNTDIILLTVMLPKNALAAVSVYTVYNLVSSALNGLMNSISNGLGSGFGALIAQKETGALQSSFSSYEYLFYMMIFAVYTCMASLMYPFIALYSASFADGGNYLNWSLVLLFSTAGLIQSLRLPGLTVVCAAGHYQQTQTRAIMEAVINLGVSIVLIPSMGIGGALIGTCASYLYRTTDVILYNAKHFLPGTLKRTVRRILRGGIAMTVTTLTFRKLLPATCDSWLSWILWAVCDGLTVGLLIVGINAVFESKEFKQVLKRFSDLFLRTRKR